MKMIRIGVINTDHFVRGELVTMIHTSDKLEYVLSSELAENFIRYFPKELDIILLNINLPSISELEVIPQLEAKFPDTEIVVLTKYNDGDWISKALGAGTSSFILKGDSIDEIEKKLIKVKQGIPVLSPSIARRMISFFKKKPIKVNNTELTLRETQVFKHLIDGLSYKLIASGMGNNVNNVRHYVKNIYKKFQIHSRPELVKLYFEGNVKLN